MDEVPVEERGVERSSRRHIAGSKFHPPETAGPGLDRSSVTSARRPEADNRAFRIRKQRSAGYAWGIGRRHHNGSAKFHSPRSDPIHFSNMDVTNPPMVVTATHADDTIAVKLEHPIIAQDLP